MTNRNIVIAGDTITLAILTVIGFATHGETGAAFLPRMIAIFIPALLSWFILAPMIGLFNEEAIADPKNLWKVAFAFLYVGPLAVLLRAAWLNTPAVPVFALAFSTSNAVGMAVWRWVYIQITRRKK